MAVEATCFIFFTPIKDRIENWSRSSIGSQRTNKLIYEQSQLSDTLTLVQIIMPTRAGVGEALGRDTLEVEFEESAALAGYALLRINTSHLCAG